MTPVEGNRTLLAATPPHLLIEVVVRCLRSFEAKEAYGMIQQTGLLAAGCQPWHINVVAFSGQRFAYAATLAVYIYEVGLETRTKTMDFPLFSGLRSLRNVKCGNVVRCMLSVAFDPINQRASFR